MALADEVCVGLFSCSEGRIVWTNRSFNALAGGGDLAARRAEDLFADSGSGVPDFALGAKPRAAGIECELCQPGGGRRGVRVRPLGEGVWEAVDTSEQTRIATELHATSQRLQQANRALAELRRQRQEDARQREHLLTVVSHELRTPITVIAGFHKLLLSEGVGPLNERQRHFLSESCKSCQRLNDFVGTLVDAAPESFAEGPFEIAETSLVHTIEGVVAFLAPLLEERGQQISLDLDEGAARASFDPMRLEQVLINLIGNAIKHGRREGRIELATQVLPPALAQSGAPFVLVSVRDDGPGIAAEDRERIFDAYVRAGERTGAAGLGLGLAICRRIVEVHGGRLEVASEPGQGSCFSFTLPGVGHGVRALVAEGF